MVSQQGIFRHLRRQGFTLVELLVVLGIIALLIGILIPVVSRAQAASRSVSCVSTLHNIGAAFHMYTQENRMTFPDPGAVGLSWEQLLQPYYHADFKCPSDEELYPSVGSSYDWRDTPDDSTSLAGAPLAMVKRPNLVLAFEALAGWHKKGKMNAVLLDGSALAMDEDACLTDLDSSIDPSLPPGFRSATNEIAAMRLLVAEDHPTLARSIANGLRDEGYAVDLTFDGEEALHMATVNPYDGIVLDIMLPNRDGFSIISALRRKGSKVPVLCLTARDAIDDRVKGLDIGADDYLVKPFAFEELIARVRAMVRRGHQQSSSVITVGDLEVDTAKKSARRGEKSIDLSAREYSLLEYLAHRQGQVVSRTQIWEHLYDEHDEASSNVVDVYIGYIRNKIDKEFPTKLIHTKRGQGYMLATEP